MKLKRSLIFLGRLASYVIIGVLCFFIGSKMGPRAQLAHLNLESKVTGELSGYLALYDGGWSGRDIAIAVCGTRSEMNYFNQTYALSGPGQFYLFTCSEVGKDTL